MSGTRSFLKNSQATIIKIIMIIIMLSVGTSSVLCCPPQYFEAHNRRNSTSNSSSLRPTKNSITVSSDKHSNTFKKLISSVRSLVSTNNTQIVGGNRILTYVDTYLVIVTQFPSNWGYKSQASAVCLLKRKGRQIDTKTTPKGLNQSCGVA
jgi:hypothetical protein